MTFEVFIVRPPTVSRATSEGRQEIDGTLYFRYDRLAECLGAAVGIRATPVDEAPIGAGSVVLDQSADRLAWSPDRGRGQPQHGSEAPLSAGRSGQTVPP